MSVQGINEFRGLPPGTIYLPAFFNWDRSVALQKKVILPEMQ